VLTASLTQTTLAAVGGHGGSGGGGFCIETKCYTLAEAGLRVPNEKPQDPWLPTVQILEELEKIKAKLPFGGDQFLTKIVGYAGVYEPVGSLRDGVRKEVLKEYEEAMRKSGFTPSSELKIFAVSSRGPFAKTYLLPEFFQLEAKQQALILIHEANIRSGLSLAEALRFDGLLLDFLANSEDWKFDRLPFYGALNQYFNRQYEVHLFWYLLPRLEMKAGRPLTLADFLDNNESDLISFFKIGGVRGRIGTIALIKNSQFEPRFQSIFRFAEIILKTEGGRDYQFYQVSGIGQRCAPFANSSGLAKYVLTITTKGNIVAVDCTKPYADGVYGGPQVYIDNVSTNYGGVEIK
jgi:hypothetical protein